MDYEKLLKNFMDDDGKLTAMPAKRKLQVAYLFYLFPLFEKGRIYTEKEINEIINSRQAFIDPCTTRRELIDYCFLVRSADCREYRVNDNPPAPEKFGLE